MVIRAHSISRHTEPKLNSPIDVMTGDDDPDGSLARRYLQTVVDVAPPLLEQCCRASQTDTRNTLQRSFFAAQLSLVECELSRLSQQEAPLAVLIGATRTMCEAVQLSLTKAWERGDGGGLRQLRQRACEQRTEIDPKLSTAWIEFGEAVGHIVDILATYSLLLVPVALLLESANTFCSSH